MVPEERGYAEGEEEGHEEHKQYLILEVAEPLFELVVLPIDPDRDEVREAGGGDEDTVQKGVAQEQHEELKNSHCTSLILTIRNIMLYKCLI